jgi:hypothetical protein
VILINKGDISEGRRIGGIILPLGHETDAEEEEERK